MALFRELDARATLAQSLQNLGDVRVSQGRCKEAESLQQESLTLAKELGSPETIAFCLETYSAGRIPAAASDATWALVVPRYGAASRSESTPSGLSPCLSGVASSSSCHGGSVRGW